jgi:endoglucanase
MNPIGRRKFLKGLAAAAALAQIARPASAEPVMPEASARKLPRWRGFNLLEKFIARDMNAPFRESDFAWIAQWGFNFVRLPMSYRCWSDPGNWRRIDERVLEEIDKAVGFGRQYGVHVCLNFHRAPGYSVDRSIKEPFSLWSDPEALEACTYHWRHFAARYRGVPNSALSFDLLNEPGIKVESTGELLDDATYARVVTALVAGIREESPDRLIIADGLSWGRIPVPALASLGIAQSTRGYEPMEITHWRANWIAGSDTWPEPTWPLALQPSRVEAFKRQLETDRRVFRENPIVARFAKDELASEPWGRERLRHQLIAPWKELESMGVGVHVGEWGCHNRTPRAACMGWMRDILPLWAEAGWGWAVWNFRGSFGILDSERPGVAYEDFKGHKLDREMLELLRAS